MDAVLTGTVARFGPRAEPSAIAKQPVDGVRQIGWLGIAGDAQADLSVHGGPDKAIHHYPHDHYDWWRARLPGCAVLDGVGAFGENISTAGLAEDDACIGDRYRLGGALVEIAQGRQPCWKQGHRLGDAGVVKAMVTSGRSGWYYRVIEEGTVARGDAIALLDRPHPDWSVARVTAIVVAGRERTTAAALADLGVLAEGWRARAKMLSIG